MKKALIVLLSMFAFQVATAEVLWTCERSSREHIVVNDDGLSLEVKIGSQIFRNVTRGNTIGFDKSYVFTSDSSREIYELLISSNGKGTLEHNEKVEQVDCLEGDVDLAALCSDRGIDGLEKHTRCFPYLKGFLNRFQVARFWVANQQCLDEIQRKKTSIELIESKLKACLLKKPIL